MTETTTRDCIAAAVEFVAGQPGAAERILHEHRRDPADRCTRCVTTPTRRPCSVARIALQAGLSRPAALP